MGYAVGIDLGTTNSVVAVRRRGSVQTLPVEGRPVMPSAIAVRGGGQLLVGQSAKNLAIIEPAQTVVSAKRFIGDGKTAWEIQGQRFTPTDVSGHVLAKLKAAAEAALSARVTEAVITVPAYFNNPQRHATKLAGEAAGLRVLQLLPEPTAAAIRYGFDKQRDQTLLVYDLGGGTFDVSVLRVDGNDFTALAVDGDAHLGGDDMDMALVEHVLGCVRERIAAKARWFDYLLGRGGRDTIAPRDLALARQRLKEAAEEAKKELSQSDTAFITLSDILGTHIEEEVSLTTYNKLIRPFVDRTIEKVKEVLNAARLRPDDVDRVILVGGSTRNRLVKERLTAAVKEPWTAESVDEVVAQGAAIVASSLSAPEGEWAPITFVNVTPFALGVRAAKGDEIDFFQILIPKNSSVPRETEHEFTTWRAHQTSVDIAVFQGEHARCKENTFIGSFRLSGIPKGPAGQAGILVKFALDASDLLAVTATCNDLRADTVLDVTLVSREDDSQLLRPTADVLFLVDTSGSMSSELDGVKRSCLDFAERVAREGVECRLGLVDFDKPPSGSKYRWEIFEPMSPVDFAGAIAKLSIGRLGGCGCYIGEPSTIPVIQAFIQAFPSDDRRLKIGILISDEVGNDAKAVADIISILQGSRVCFHVLGVRGSCHEKLARETGGCFWDIHATRGKVRFEDLLAAVAHEITVLALR